MTSAKKPRRSHSWCRPESVRVEAADRARSALFGRCGESIWKQRTNERHLHGDDACGDCGVDNADGDVKGTGAAEMSVERIARCVRLASIRARSRLSARTTRYRRSAFVAAMREARSRRRRVLRSARQRRRRAETTAQQADVRLTDAAVLFVPALDDQLRQTGARSVLPRRRRETSRTCFSACAVPASGAAIDSAML